MMAVISLLALLYGLRVDAVGGVHVAAPRLTPSDAAIWSFIPLCACSHVVNYSYLPFRHSAMLLTGVVGLGGAALIGASNDRASAGFGFLFLAVNACVVAVACYLREATVHSQCATRIAALEAEGEFRHGG